MIGCLGKGKDDPADIGVTKLSQKLKKGWGVPTFLIKSVH